MTSDEDKIRSVVREVYGMAAASRSSCCGTADRPADGAVDCCSSARFYNVDMIADLPADITGLSMGCGDPVTIASLKPGEIVLDLGSGGGIDCFLAARPVGETGRVIGVDMTPEMIARANTNREKVGATNVEFRQGLIEQLPVEDNSVDVVISNCVINLSPDKVAVFREAFRVLKPGGRLSVSDIVTEGEFSPELRARADLWAECIAGAIDLEDYLNMMLDAGFVDIEVQERVEAIPVTRRVPGVPRIFSVRIVAHKPAGPTDS